MVKTIRLIVFAVILGIAISVQGQQVKKKELTEKEFADELTTMYIVTEFQAKNITLTDACNKLNDLFVHHQKVIGSKDAHIFKIQVAENIDNNDSMVFLHVKRISLKTILMIICEQSSINYHIKDRKIEFISGIE